MQSNERLLRLPEVISMTGLSKTTIWRYERMGNFPKHYRITLWTSAWKLIDIESYIAKVTANI